MVHIADEPPSPPWSTLETYGRFLSEALTEQSTHRLAPTNCTIKIEVWLWLERPTLALGPALTVAISPTLRRSLRAHLRSGAGVADGPGRLFLAVAWVELWHDLGVRGWVTHRRLLSRWAKTRAQGLIRRWLRWTSERCLDRVWLEDARRARAREWPE